MSDDYTFFNPPDDELITRYLDSKITGNDGLGTGSKINEVNIIRHAPADIPGLAKMKSSNIWHVIVPVEKLRGLRQRTKRSCKTGHWKVTGDPAPVTKVGGDVVVGYKKYLVFKEKKKPPSSSTSTVTQQNNFKWVIHEFHSSIQHRNKDAYVLCKLMKLARTSRSNTVVNASPVAVVTDLSPADTSDPQFQQMLNDNNLLGDDDTDTWEIDSLANIFFGSDYFPLMENIFTAITSTDRLGEREV